MQKTKAHGLLVLVTTQSEGGLNKAGQRSAPGRVLVTTQSEGGLAVDVEVDAAIVVLVTTQIEGGLNPRHRF